MVTARRGKAGVLSAREAEPVLRGSGDALPPLVLAAGEEDFLRERLVRAFREGAEAQGAEFQRLEGP